MTTKTEIKPNTTPDYNKQVIYSILPLIALLMPAITLLAVLMKWGVDTAWDNIHCCKILRLESRVLGEYAKRI